LREALYTSKNTISANNRDRLLIPLLAARTERICCILPNIRSMIFPETPTDVFVFSRENWAEAHVAEECPRQKANGPSGSTVRFRALVYGQVGHFLGLMIIYLR
jgi:hypothetical protein